MNAPDFESLFESDLGSAVLVHLFGEGGSDGQAQVWAPVLTTDGTWGCKVVTSVHDERMVSVMPGDDALSSLLLAASFVGDIGREVGHVSPEIWFPGQPGR